jgi:hypothetical protein
LALWGEARPDTLAEIEARSAEVAAGEETREREKREREEKERREREERERQRLERESASRPATPQRDVSGYYHTARRSQERSAPQPVARFRRPATNPPSPTPSATTTRFSAARPSGLLCRALGQQTAARRRDSRLPTEARALEGNGRVAARRAAAELLVGRKALQDFEWIR